jgi:alpha-L-rhamnosidase
MRNVINIFLLSISVFFASAQTEVSVLQCENLLDPIGIDVIHPRFSWQLNSLDRNAKQVGYEIRISRNRELLQAGKDVTWTSGKVNSDQSQYIQYKGPGLESAKKYFWQVRIWDNSGRMSSWSAPSVFSMGLLSPNDWKAKWILPNKEDESRASPLFRKQFSLKKKVVSATAFITAHGLYEAEFNGHRVGDAYLTPGWTSYKKRLQYQGYDVTALLQSGSNAIGITLGNGWYRGVVGFSNKADFYGNDIALLFQLHIVYSDGSTEIVASDNSWKCSTGSIRYNEIYHGETIDARQHKKGWTLPGYNDLSWDPVKTADFPFDNLVATVNEPVKKHETFQPLKTFVTPKGEKVIDYGQNIVGWVKIKIKGKAGDTIRISHAEVLDKKGNFYTDNLRSAKAQDTYVLKGGEEELFEPHFTWHGFRYIKVEGYSGDLSSQNFEAVALYSAMKQTGSFTTSNALINRLQQNILWGQKGNFIDVPTDCPQRDERLGWTGDAQVFARTASFNMDVRNFFSKWLKDVAADQIPDGSVPAVVPNIFGNKYTGSAGWADAATVIPWEMYLAYGDKETLEQQYPSMKAWVGYMEAQSKNGLWNTGFHYGDWLYFRSTIEKVEKAAITDNYLIAQCFYAYSTQLLINSAKILGKAEDVERYTKLLKVVKEAFLKEYLTPNGRLLSGTQTAYTLALQFDMLPESLRAQTAEKLVNNIKDYKNHLTTGFLGTPYLCHVLTRFGYNNVAYKLLLQETYPSWLYPVKMGATTIWERWDGQKTDSTFQDPGMNSFNHYAYGAIGDWMYRKMAGLDTYEDGVGYKHIKIQPNIGDGIRDVSASMQTGYGKLSSSWKLGEHKIQMEVTIPANTTATVYIPTDVAESITEGNKPLSQVKEISIKSREKGFIVLELGSGNYKFESEYTFIKPAK